MVNVVTGAAKMFAGQKVEQFAQKFEPDDPFYEYYDDNGKRKHRKRPLPPGLTKHEAKILRKINKRAHVLDKGFSICGLRFGWTFIIGLIPFAGEIADFCLGQNLIIKKAQEIEGFPPELVRQMQANTTLSTGVGFIPLVGDLFVATYKANSRNAHIVEKCTFKIKAHSVLRERGQENMKKFGGAMPPYEEPSYIPLRRLFGVKQTEEQTAHQSQSLQPQPQDEVAQAQASTVSQNQTGQVPPPPPPRV